MGNRCCIAAGNLTHAAGECGEEDPVFAAVSSAVLNRWRCVEVATLQAKFRNHANNKRLFDQHGFEELFPFLKDYPSSVRQSMFRAFHHPRKSAIDFHDFCWTLSLCVHGTETEMEHLLYSMFTGSYSTAIRSGEFAEEHWVGSGGSDRNRSTGLEMRAVTQLQQVPSTDRVPAENCNGHVLHFEGAADEYKQDDEPRLLIANGGASGFEGSEKLNANALQAMLRFCDLSTRIAEEIVAECPSGGLDFAHYMEMISKHFTHDMITAALKQFDLLPSAAQERDLVQAALAQLTSARQSGDAEENHNVVEEGDTVYLLVSSWWRQWCSYVKVIPQYDMSSTYVTGLEWMDGNTTPTHRSRPNEIDNSALQSPTDPVNLKPGLHPGEDCDYVALPPAVWQQLLELYGGGPVLQRRVSHVGHADPKKSSLTSDGAQFTVVVDPYPVLLKGYWCNRFGKPEPMESELIISSRSTILSLLNRGIREHQLQHALTADQVRVWVLKFNLPEDAGAEKSGRTQTAIESEQSPDVDAPQQEGSTNASSAECNSPKALMIRSGLTSWWVLLDENDRRLTLEELELGSGARIMFEVQNAEQQWPIDRLIEPPAFRNLKVDDRVDAMDYQGRWYTGTVVQVQQYSGMRSSMGVVPTPGVYNFPTSSDAAARTSAPGATEGSATYVKIRVHFDKFSPKWDEWYDQNSHKLAPIGSYTIDHAALPPITVLEKPVSEIPLPTKINGQVPVSARGIASQSETAQHAADESSKSKPATAKSRMNLCGGLYGVLSLAMAAHRDNDMIYEPTNKTLYNTVGRRRGVNGARPNVLGACGLVNLGNTCFLNTALQCLSHTPLFRAYLLSNRFLLDVNRQNPLGTQGRIVEEYASLLRQLWSGESMYVVPSKFKRVLEKYKPQFVGNDQQDAQEFLAEMLDCLHEDVNRVLTKPYVPGLEDEEIARLTLKQHADESWQRHLARNRSVLVDLFQGQLRNEVKCPQCHKVSRTFDPFMFLSVPIPRQHEVVVTIVFHFRLRARSSHDPRSRKWMEKVLEDVLSDDELEELPTIAQDMLSDRVRPIKLAIKLPKLSDIGELKTRIARLTNLRPECMNVAEVYRHRFHRFLDDRQPVAYLRENDTIHVYESTKNVRRVYSWTAKRLSSPDCGLLSRPQTDGTSTENGQASAGYGLKHPKEETEGYYSEDDDDVLVKKLSNGEGNIVVDLDNTDELLGLPRAVNAAQTKKATSPWKSVNDLRVGMRVDAADHRNQWFTGSIVDIKPASDEHKAGVWVHFDHFSSKWDEMYTEQDIKSKRLLPAYSRTSRKIKVLDLQVIHRRLYVSPVTQQPVVEPTGAGADVLTNSEPTVVRKNPMEVFGDPYVVFCEGYRSAEHAYRQIVLQALRCVDPEYRKQHDLMISDPETADREDFWARQDRLPFTIRLVSTQNPFVGQRENEVADEGGTGRLWEGCSFPRCTLRPASNIQHRQLLIAVDWHTPSAYWKENEVPRLHKSFTRWQEQQARDGSATSGVTLHDCLKAFTSEEELEEASWYCSKCKEHRQGVMNCALWRLPDILVIHLKRFNCSARFREKIRTKVVFPLTSLDLSEYVSNVVDSRDASNRANNSPADYVYDLYAVSNHLGGMAGGHYTAFVNCVPCRPDGVEEVAISSRDQSDGKWLHFDDEFVEEIPPDRVVSDAAYVLFYRKRRLTPSNIINMTV